MRRKKLPAPPLVLEATLIRAEATDLDKLKEIASFLRQRGHLTDGGVKNLEVGFSGRNGFYSLTSQDVRGWAQALAKELWSIDSSRWFEVCEDYFFRYDKGKPRRPNHLQRLYLDWSPDCSWPGLLAASRSHPELWEELSTAVERLQEDHPERELLRLACRARNCPELLWEEFEGGRLSRELFHQMCGSLPWELTARLEMLSRSAPTASREQGYSLICAASVELSEAQKVFVPCDEIEVLARRILPYFAERHRAEFFTGFRSFIRDPDLWLMLRASLALDDPLRRVRFGSRPGTLWFEAVGRELVSLSALRRERISP